MVVGIGRLRHALGDAATEQQARNIRRLLLEHGYREPTEPDPPIDESTVLVGVGEIADLAGVSTSHVCNWRNMPRPVVVLKSGTIWRLQDVQPRIDACLARKERRHARTEPAVPDVP